MYTLSQINVTEIVRKQKKEDFVDSDYGFISIC